MMKLRVIQATVSVILLYQSDSHLCGTIQCDSYNYGNGKLELRGLYYNISLGMY